MNPFDLPGPEFLQLYGAWLVAAVVAAALLRWRLRQPAAELAVRPELSLYEAAYLAGGAEWAANAALTRLVDAGVLEVDAAQAKLTVRAELPAAADPLEVAIHQAAQGNEGQPIKEVRAATAAQLSRDRQRLLELGLLVADGQALLARCVPALVVLSLVPVALVKIGIGLERGKPVELLVVAGILTVAIAGFGFGQGVHRSRHGDHCLRRLRAEHVALESTARYQALTGGDLVAAVALFGMPVLANGPQAHLRTALQPPPGASCAGGGCGSGCGGGGCGGGCGGCGG